ncbi:uncharacterized protein [Engystomops pustulosus]|uniref:uncharacterized protein n=1 Tax=Engystomops pustulosus TaxID=76066 RepID=UPI003AFA3B8A
MSAMHPLFMGGVAILMGMASRRRRILQKKRLQRLQPKRLWIHPLLQIRDTHGHFCKIYAELRRYPLKFKAFCRLNVMQFDLLLQLCSSDLSKKETVMRCAISATERLLVTLRFLASGESYGSLHLQFLIGKSTISYIVRETAVVIWQKLQPIFMPFPDLHAFDVISANFLAKTNFPNCIGALDGKHIRVIQPPNSGSQYFNYKKFFSVGLLALADADSNFIAIETGSYGSTNDSRIWETSAMGKQLIGNHINVPTPKTLAGTNTSLPLVFIGDEAFGLSSHLVRPFCSRGLTNRKRIFNVRLARARKVIECAFGILANQWRIFRGSLCVHVDNVDILVKACCVLHNFIRHPNFEAMMQVRTEEPLREPTRDLCNCHIVSGWRVRDELTNYFCSDAGAVTWQYSQL